MSQEESSAAKPKRNFVVAIDGPAGAGKSTIARHLARHYGLLNLETGAMYRAFALKALRVEVPLDDANALQRLAAETEIQLESGENENRVLLDGEDVTGQIRNQTVTDAASRVSIFPAVRASMVRRQQEMATKGGVVMEGRDIGTVVFPDAEVKIFLDAAPEVRGDRRYRQKFQGQPEDPKQTEAVIAELRERGRHEALQGINSRLFERIRRLPMPTLAAVPGWALGGGAELAYACDLRIAGPDAVFGNPEPGLGILAAAGACWRLRELVGESVAKQVLLAGRTLDAPAALACGLLMDVVPANRLISEAHALLDRMARSSALALRLTKLVTDAPGAHPVADDLAQAVLFEGSDKKERMTRFLEKDGDRT